MWKQLIQTYKGEMCMLDKIPNAEEMTALVGQSLYSVWNGTYAVYRFFEIRGLLLCV